MIRYHGKSRSDVGLNCVERFDVHSLRFLFRTLSFNRKNRAYFYEIIAKFPEENLIVLKNRKEVKRFLQSFPLDFS